MTMEDRPDQQGEHLAMDHLEDTQRAITLVAVKEPLAPKSMDDKEAQEVKARALEVVKQLGEASGSKEMEIVDSITTLGIQAQRHAGADLELLRARVGDMISSEAQGTRVSKDLVDLRLALNQINPHELSKPGFVGRLVTILPFASRLRFLLRALEKVSIRYETVSKQVVVIETRLREGQLMLRRDNIELRKLYEQVEAQQVPIQRNAYLGELVMQQLDELIRRAEDPLKKDRVQNALYDVSMRVQDLRTMQEVHVQLFVSMEMTRQNNTRLGQSVDRTLTLATNLVMVGLAIQSALARQRRVLEATRRTREFMGNLLVANAAAIKQHTTEIGDIYKNPVIALEKIAQAHNDLIEAMDIADRLKTEGIESARENIAKLSQLAAELERRAMGLSEQREAQSLEA